MCKTFAYLRISTGKQDLDVQRLEIETYATKNNLKIDEWLSLEVSSKKSFHDRKIDELLSSLKRCDTLVISELSRLARSIFQVHQILDILISKKINLIIIKQGIATNGQDDLQMKIMLNTLGICAELERTFISQRTKAGLDNARKRGVKLGNPSLKNNVDILKQGARDFAEKLRPILTGLISQEMKINDMVSEMNRLNIPTRRNGQWSYIQLQRVLKTLELKTLN